MEVIKVARQEILEDRIGPCLLFIVACSCFPHIVYVLSHCLCFFYVFF